MSRAHLTESFRRLVAVGGAELAVDVRLASFRWADTKTNGHLKQRHAVLLDSVSKSFCFSFHTRSYCSSRLLASVPDIVHRLVQKLLRLFFCVYVIAGD